MENLKLHETISFYRKKQGLTQEELARKLGVTNQSVSKWELAQCCPDIALIPDIADLFEISIDELFAREGQKENRGGAYMEVSWEDDDRIRIVQTIGRKLIKAQEGDTCMEIAFPSCSGEGEKQCFTVEVLGNVKCDSVINGDVVSHGSMECGDIYGNVQKCEGDIACKGDIHGNVTADNNLSCGRSIGGNVSCDNNLSCGGSIGGDVSCDNNLSCGGSINGAVTCENNVSCTLISGNVRCDGDIRCEKIEGDVKCEGDIIYKK